MHPHAEDGLKEELSSLAKDTGRYLQARAELLAIEAQEAGQLLQKKSKAFALCLFFALPAYILLITAGTAFLGKLLQSQGEGPLFSWLGAALGLGIFHLIIALIFLVKALKAPREPLFAYTRQEWLKDQSWINENGVKKN